MLYYDEAEYVSWWEKAICIAVLAFVVVGVVGVCFGWWEK